MESEGRREIARHRQAELARLAERELLLTRALAGERLLVQKWWRARGLGGWRRWVGVADPELPDAPGQPAARG